MKLIAYLKSILPFFKKEVLLEDLRVSRSELSQAVIPSYKQAAEFFKNKPFKSAQAKALNTLFFNGYSERSGRGNLVVEIEGRLQAFAQNMDTVQEMSEDLLAADILADGLSAKKAILVRAADYMGVMVDFMLDLLAVVYYHESIEKLDGNAQETLAINKFTMDKVEKCAADFGRLLQVYGQDNTGFLDALKNVPDVVVNSKTSETIVSVYREDKLDPVGAPLTNNFQGSPIYAWRLRQAERQAARYKLNKDKKKMLELRLLYLKGLLEEKPDPAIEKEIEYLQSRIEKLEYEIKQQEG